MSGVTIHTILEALSYFVGGQVYWWQRRRLGDVIDGPNRLAVAGFSILGAALGSRLLAAFEDPANFTLAGKTIVGGLLGGLIAVELGKKVLGVRHSTGDLFAVPLCVGIALGRVGCFLSGLDDNTHGSPTSLPWAHDYGDGVPRHPAQLYEIAFVLALIPILARLRGRMPRNGDLFKLFMVAYFGFRLLADFLTPGYPRAGLTVIQWACAAALAYYASDILRWISAAPRELPKEAAANG